jgi:HrpA-like RNA helicase
MQVLLRQLAGDPLLSQYDVILVDEVHERHISTDFLLAVFQFLLPRRPELKVVLMSATIDTARFSEYFGGAPIITVPGRSYPVTVEYIEQRFEDIDYAPAPPLTVAGIRGAPQWRKPAS